MFDQVDALTNFKNDEGVFGVESLENFLNK